MFILEVLKLAREEGFSHRNVKFMCSYLLEYRQPKL